MSLFTELQRRSVFKVAAAYLVVGWLLIQIAATVAPQLDLPTWAPRLITLLVALGFPVALLLAWAFEMTPEGVKVDAGGAGSKRMFLVVGAITVLVLGWWLRTPGTAVEAGAADARSIAVLPFVNMSGDAENEYFSDGISEEILNSLAQMDGVKVAARTSSFSFKGNTKEIPEIARELEVRMVLEGSVRKQGERVRITAQLIDATKGFHVWSQTYDRDLKDIFAIQDEIAHAIANELQVKLAAAHDDKADTKDLAAYDEYLKGMQLWQAREEPNLREADRLFRSALKRDPDFAKARAGLALVWLVLPEWSNEPLAPAWSIARDAAEHASALDPTLPEPQAVLGYIALAENRLATGRALFARVHALAPSYATGWQWNGEGLIYAGDNDGAIVATKRAVQLDPKSPVVSQAAANALFYKGRDAEAIAVCDAVLAERPDWLNCLSLKFDAAVWRKDHAEPRAMLRRMAAPRGEEAQRFAEQVVDAIEGKADAKAVMQKLAVLGDGNIDTTLVSPLSDSEAILLGIEFGQPAMALPRARAQLARIPYVMRSFFYDPHFAALSCLPEYAAMAKQLTVDDAQVARMCALSKQPRQVQRSVPTAPPKKS